MSFSIPPPNLRLIRAQTTPAAGMPHEYTSSAHTTNSRNLSPLRPLPTPPSSASVHSSRRSGSIRPLPSLPPSRCTTPEPKQPSSGPHHARNGSYSSMCSSSSSVEVTTLSKAAVHKDLSIIPLSLRPAVRQNIGQTSNSYHQSPSSSRRPTSREKLSFACSSSRVSQPIYKKKRPQLHIKIEPSEEEEKPPVKLPDLTIPIPKRQSSLDSLTLRTPSFLSPDQALSPVISRRRRKSSQPASSMMLLSMAIRDANANAKQLRTYPEVAAEKRTSLQDSDDDELCSLDNGSSLVFDLSASPEGAQFLHFKKGMSPLPILHSNRRSYTLSQVLHPNAVHKMIIFIDSRNHLVLPLPLPAAVGQPSRLPMLFTRTMFRAIQKQNLKSPQGNLQAVSLHYKTWRSPRLVRERQNSQPRLHCSDSNKPPYYPLPPRLLASERFQDLRKGGGLQRSRPGCGSKRRAGRDGKSETYMRFCPSSENYGNCRIVLRSVRILLDTLLYADWLSTASPSLLDFKL